MEIHSEHAPLRGETILESTIPNDLSAKTPLTLRLVGTLLEAGLIKEEDGQKFEVCFEEALKNAIVHGNGADPETSVRVRLFRDGNEWGADITDEGNGFGPDDVPDPNDPEFPWREEGRGIHLMAHIADRVEYYAGGRTVVISHAVSGVTAGDDGSLAGGDEGPLRLSNTGGALVAELCLGSADETEVSGVFTELLEAVRSGEPRLVLLDLSGVPFLASYGIACIIRVYKTCIGAGHSFALTGVSDALREVFATMRLDKIFSVYATVEKAIAEQAPAGRC